MGERYPDYIPAPLAEVLGMPPYELHPWFMALREVGVDVPRKYEGEISAALFFLIPFAVSHPDDWRGAAIAELRRLKDGALYEPTVVFAPEPLVKTLRAAIHALRSYQYGNSSTELAQEIADAGDEALRAAGLERS